VESPDEGGLAADSPTRRDTPKLSILTSNLMTCQTEYFLST